MASKTINIQKLTIKNMTLVSSQVQNSLAALVTDILNFDPQGLELLDLSNAGFDELAGEDLCKKLDHEGVTQLTNF